MLAGDVAERHDGTERNAGPWVIAAHDTRAIIADRIEPRNRLECPIQHAANNVSREPVERAEIAHHHLQCIIRSLGDWRDIRVGPLFGITKETVESRGPPPEFGILANPRDQIVTIYGFLKRLSVNAGGLRKLAQRLSGLQVAVAYIDADRHRPWLGITKTVFPDGRMVADQPRRSLRIPLAIGNHRCAGVVIGIGLVGKAFAAAIHRDDAGLVAVD